MAKGRRTSHAWVRKKRVNLSSTQIIALAFAGIILTGAMLLTLPAASRSGESCGFRPALFTATSATCVTGLVLYDTWTQWSGFGQFVILCMIELGGLGFMAAASVVVFLLRRKIGLKQRMLIAQAYSLNDIQGVVRLQQWVILGSLIIQAAGALILFLHFLPHVGFRQSLIWGVFHSVSAFCNAGFDIFGSFAPGQSAVPFQSDPVVCITLMLLISVGGLGFFVWEEVVRVHNFKKLSIYTKLVLVMTASLIIGGAILFGIMEWNNPDTFGNMSTGDKILNAFFQSVTLRTAGFAAIDEAMLTDASKAVSVLLMLTGGSSGSTAGGIKTVTVMVLLLFIHARARGKSSVNVFCRTIPSSQIMDAMTIAIAMIGLAFFGALFITVTSPVSFIDSLFEAASALATVGVTAGATTLLSIPAQILIIIFMYFGRVGVLTISLGFMMGNKAEERFQYAQTNLLIG